MNSMKINSGISPEKLKALILAKAGEFGFMAAGIAPAKALPEKAHYHEWIAGKMHASMDYMEREPEKRADISRWFPQSKSVLAVAMSYFRTESGPSGDEYPEPVGLIARYALSHDYHEVMKKKLKELLSFIQTLAPSCQGKIFLDTSPVLERLYSRYAGLGWIGKNTMLINPKGGSYFFLGGIALDLELPFDEPVPDHCGECTKCLEACPTSAFPRPYTLDASRCIAYYTIEHRGPIPEPTREKIGNWIFGCDLCQEACPWNRFAPEAPEELKPVLPREIPLSQAAQITLEQFRSDFKKTPVARAKWEGFRRNIEIALGNTAKALTVCLLLMAVSLPVSAQEEPEKKPALRKLPVGAVEKPKEKTAAQEIKELGETVIKGEVEISTSPAKLVKETVQTVSLPIRFLKDTLTLVVTPIKNGMFVSIPTIDTDPNRGLTYGIMPVWVINERTKNKAKENPRIIRIFAPAFTYNAVFKWTLTYRGYFFPTEESQCITEASLSGETNRGAVVKYDDEDFMGKDMALEARIQYDKDGGYRFFGFGPDSKAADESNYTHDVMLYRIGLGYPLGRNWKIYGRHQLQGQKVTDGPFSTLPGISAKFPGQVVANRQQLATYRLYLTYDTRDKPITPKTGFYFEAFTEISNKALASARNFESYGLEGKWYRPHGRRRNPVFAIRGRIEQKQGRDIPFYALPSLGGKYILRGFGEGRFRDKGLWVVGIEERFNGYEFKAADTPVEIEFSPFFEAGTVYGQPKQMALRDVYPVVGIALRAVARPQIVGSLDLGYGGEGITAFMDINYSF